MSVRKRGNSQYRYHEGYHTVHTVEVVAPVAYSCLSMAAASAYSCTCAFVLGVLMYHLARCLAVRKFHSTATFSQTESQACNNVLDLSMASLPIHGGLWRAWLSRGFLVVPLRSCLGTPYLHWWRLPRIVYSCLTNPRRQMLCFRLVVAYTLNEDMTTMRLASAAIPGTLFFSYTMCNGPECPTGSSGTVIHICMNTTVVICINVYIVFNFFH